MCYVSYNVLNLSTSLPILVRRASHCELLNKLIQFDRIFPNNLQAAPNEEQNFKIRIKIVSIAILIAFVGIFPCNS